MPMYMYRCSKCNEITQRTFSVKARKASVQCHTCQDVAYRDYGAEHGSVPHHPGNWPLLSDAAGVNPDQIGQAREYAAKVGVPTEFTRDGRAILTSAEHRKRYCEAHGLFDRNAGPSDPLPRNL